MVRVARINKLFGNDGSLVATLYDTFPERVAMQAPLWAEVDGLAVPLFLSAFERRGRSSAILRFEDIDTPRRATELLSRELSLELADEVGEASGEWVGFEAIVEGVAQVARVTAQVDGANPLLELTLAGREILVPQALTTRVDRRSRKIYLSLPEGLIELND